MKGKSIVLGKILVVMGIFVLMAIAMPAVVTSASDTVSWGGHSYLVVTAEKTWHDARFYAESLDGHLVTISDEAENTFVTNLAREKGVPKHFWIGLTDEVEEGNFVWVTGEPLIYTNWYSGEPNNKYDEDYVLIGWHTKYSWNDGCNEQNMGYMPFVVEFEETMTTPSRGPVGYWNFDEGSGNTAYDSSGNGNHGTKHGATWVDGRCKKALSFDGTEDSVQIPHTVINNLLDITFSAWIKTDANEVGIFSGANSDRDNELTLYIRNGKLLLHIKSEKDIFSERSINDGSWHHISVVRKGNSGIAQIFIDGQLDKTVQNSLTGNLIIDPDGLWIGREQDRVGGDWGNQDFKGIIDEVRIYNYALTQSEIQGDMNACRPGDTLVKKPDLTPYEITWEPSSPTTNDDITITWKVKNGGDADAVGKFYTELYVDGKKKKSWPTDGLALGQETSGSMNIDKLSAEEYPVTVKTDATGAISESNEGNNEYSKTVTVTETKKPDLTPYNISWEPSSPSTSDNIAIIWKVRNQGNADAVGRFYTELYVDDEYKARWYKDGLAAGDEVYDARYIGTLSAGNHMVTVVTDTNGTIDECNESNNKYDVSLAVTKAKELDLTPYRFVTKWGRLVSGDGRLSSPEGIAVDISGYVYVADSLYKRIQKFDSYGNFITKWGSSGNGDGQFIRPQGIAVDRHRCVYVADSYNNQIQKFYSQGTFIRKWGSSGNGDGQFSSPVGIAVDSNLNVYVADKGNGRIQKFDYHGNFITKWGSNGTRDGQFYSPYGPHGIAVDSSGNVYVTDYGNDRIQKFDSNGKFITKWESHGSGDGHFYSPYGIAVDSSGNVFVVDPNNNRIQKFDSSGKFITKWGSHGTGNGQFISPESIAVDSSGNVYVADYYTGLIQKFAPCTPTPTSENGGTGFDDAIELSDGQTLSGEVVKGEEDYYKFYLNEGQEATVTMQPLDDDQDLYIYNPSRVPIDVSGNSGTSTEECPFTADTSGYYYAKVGRFEAGSYTITLTISGESSPGAGGGTSFDDAIELTEGQPQTGNVVKAEEDYYKFYLDEGQEATVTMQPLDDDQDLYIYNPSRVPIDVSGNSGTSTEECPFTADVSGYYYAMVGRFGAGSYTITLTISGESSPGAGGGTSFDDAIALSDGQNLIGDVVGGEVVYYRFYLSAGQEATVTLQPNRYIYNPNMDLIFALHIYNPSKDQIHGKGNFGKRTECTFTADVNGYYYAKVRIFEAVSYTISLTISGESST